MSSIFEGNKTNSAISSLPKKEEISPNFSVMIVNFFLTKMLVEKLKDFSTNRQCLVTSSNSDISILKDIQPRGNCNQTPRLETRRFQMRHFGKPRFPCFELQKLD